MTQPTQPLENERRPQGAWWKPLVAQYTVPSRARASWQLANSVGGYALLWAVMFFTLKLSWWLTVPLAVLAGGLLVRVFIIFHDCGHGSFLASRRANDFWGFVCGILTFTPYYHWRWEHGLHHATAGDLDRRGIGDVWTLTVQEYLEAGRWKRFAYRMARNPVVLFVLAPLYVFIIEQRFTTPGASKRERHSVWMMNIALAAMAASLIMVYGWLPYLILQSITVAVAGSGGIWLFYVQHQFEDVYWERHPDWDFADAALKGSSYYALPKILQWFSGNIGFHHIHHLSPRIPNYNLERCHKAAPVFQDVPKLTLLSSFKSLKYRLWDEQNQELIGWRRFKEVREELREELRNQMSRRDLQA